MKEIALIGCGALCAVLPAWILYAVLHNRYRAKGIYEPRLHLLWIVVFTVYLAGVFHFTGTGTIYNIRQYGMDNSVTTFNLIPFSATEFDVESYLLNIVLLVPLGVFLPLIWQRQDRFLKILLAGFGFSLLIELSQLVNIRNSDIDDLLLNTLGAVIGYLLYRLFKAMFKRKAQPQAGLSCEPLLYVCAAFLGRFLLFNEFGLAKILYGF